MEGNMEGRFAWMESMLDTTINCYEVHRDALEKVYADLYRLHSGNGCIHLSPSEADTLLRGIADVLENNALKLPQYHDASGPRTDPEEEEVVARGGAAAGRGSATPSTRGARADGPLEGADERTPTTMTAHTSRQSSVAERALSETPSTRRTYTNRGPAPTTPSDASVDPANANNNNNNNSSRQQPAEEAENAASKRSNGTSNSRSKNPSGQERSLRTQPEEDRDAAGTTTPPPANIPTATNRTPSVASSDVFYNVNKDEKVDGDDRSNNNNNEKSTRSANATNASVGDAPVKPQQQQQQQPSQGASARSAPLSTAPSHATTTKSNNNNNNMNDNSTRSGRGTSAGSRSGRRDRTPVALSPWPVPEDRSALQENLGETSSERQKRNPTLAEQFQSYRRGETPPRSSSNPRTHDNSHHHHHPDDDGSEGRTNNSSTRQQHLHPAEDSQMQKQQQQQQQPSTAASSRRGDLPQQQQQQQYNNSQSGRRSPSAPSNASAADSALKTINNRPTQQQQQQPSRPMDQSARTDRSAAPSARQNNGAPDGMVESMTSRKAAAPGPAGSGAPQNDHHHNNNNHNNHHPQQPSTAAMAEEEEEDYYTTPRQPGQRRPLRTATPRRTHTDANCSRGIEELIYKRRVSPSRNQRGPVVEDHPAVEAFLDDENRYLEARRDRERREVANAPLSLSAGEQRHQRILQAIGNGDAVPAITDGNNSTSNSRAVAVAGKGGATTASPFARPKMSAAEEQLTRERGILQLQQEKLQHEWSITTFKNNETGNEPRYRQVQARLARVQKDLERVDRELNVVRCIEARGNRTTPPRSIMNNSTTTNNNNNNDIQATANVGNYKQYGGVGGGGSVYDSRGSPARSERTATSSVPW